MNYESMNKETLVKILREKDNLLEKLTSERKKLNYYANIDPMTGVLNRRSGLELLSKEFGLSEHNDRNLVVSFVDVDRLKIINDNFGHEEGDKLLISVAQILKESIRKTDFVIRMGGDEFIVVFPKTTIEEVNKAWHRILKKVEEINKNNDSYDFSLSYGVYEYNKETEKGVSITDIIKKADTEMYKEKKLKNEYFSKV
ncbi:GGDEF domain-containing protein [Clostridium sp. A1-XYC3]|uniref:GGDEF domain-containing protein n=1 Tax=Clostridium tanneri TaxID=3037988 RepID=A0ABU4JWG0_9CLOT|nr:GGDEF domain-containing protein [Clostridium sp. A1-XYC3]MDW8802505.1 GGDEF domain-containing protein [Clostridium sp. A1-XYC3]